MDFQEMMKNFKTDMENMQKQLKDKTVEVEIDDMVTVSANGLNKIDNININPKVFKEDMREELEKNLVKACNDVLEKARLMVKNELEKMVKDFDIGDLSNFFNMEG